MASVQMIGSGLLSYSPIPYYDICQLGAVSMYVLFVFVVVLLF
jgi:hypothetical protein